MTYLTAMSTGGPGYPEGRPVPELKPRLVCEFQTFVLSNHVTTVLASPSVSHPEELRELYVRALGPPSESVGGIDAWYRIERADDWCNK